MEWSLCLLKVLLLVITFSPPSTESKRRNPTCPLKNPFKTLTYNAILLDNAWVSKGLPIPNNRIDRREALIDYLKTTDACVVCLQEVYLGPDVQAIVEGLSDKFPYGQSQLHLFNGVLPPQTNVAREPVCDGVAVASALACLIPTGCTIDGGLGPFTLCFIAACPSQVLDLYAGGSRCIYCLLNGLPDNFESCTEAAAPEDRLDINPMGLVLLSKRPMSNRLVVPHYQGVVQTLQRGYIQATIDKKLTFACSHQTTTDSISFEPFLAQFIPNADAQNNYEIDDLIARLGDKDSLVLMGDMNVGGSFPGVLPVKEERYKRLVDVFKADSAKECTFCANNLYNVLDNTDVDVKLDHIFTTAPLKVTNAKVVLKTDDASVSIEMTEYPLSDHYGVEATIECSNHRTAKHRRSSKRGHRGYRRHA